MLAIREGTCMSILGHEDGARRGTALCGLAAEMALSGAPRAGAGTPLFREANPAWRHLPARTREDDDGGPPCGRKRERFRGFEARRSRAGAGFGRRQVPAGSGGSVETDRLRADTCGEVASCLAAGFSTAPPAPFP
jgi:hypothetical protein